MNLHLMIIMLAFKAPVPVEPLELMEAPQVVCPASLFESRATLKELKKKNEQLFLRKQYVWKPYVYQGKDGRYHAVWSEIV